MAKRTRYAGRPSGRRPSSSRPLKSPPTRAPLASTEAAIPDVDIDLDRPAGAHPIVRTSGLTEAEVQRAAELEAEVTARERAAIAESIRRRARGHSPEANVLAGDVNAPLSVRAAHEYAYVARDVRRILLTGGLMVAILAVLAILINVMGVITL
ncbi:MAG TPA: hypothetical protein VGQ85_01880 [Candidatus Limnocylindrales bacterium]|nr:hypothetical protein [Candidatus Limnocylindrales bacterium]